MARVRDGRILVEIIFLSPLVSFSLSLFLFLPSLNNRAKGYNPSTIELKI